MLHIPRALKSHLVQTYKFQASEVHNLVRNFMQKSFIPNGCHPFDDVGRVKVHFQSNIPSIILSHICSSFSFTLPHEQLVCFWIAHTKANIVSEQLDFKKHLQIES